MFKFLSGKKALTLALCLTLGNNAFAIPVDPSASQNDSQDQSLPNPFYMNESLTGGTRVYVDENFISPESAYFTLGHVNSQGHGNLLDDIQTIKFNRAGSASISRHGHSIQLQAQFGFQTRDVTDMLLVARLQRVLIEENFVNPFSFQRIQGHASLLPGQILSTLRKVRAVNDQRNIENIREVKVQPHAHNRANSLEGGVLSIKHSITQAELLNLLPIYSRGESPSERAEAAAIARE